MKIYKHLHTRKIFVCFSIWCFFMTGQSYQAFADEPSGQIIRIIPNEEMPIILNLIGSQIRDNYERIITWSGEINVKLNMLHTGARVEDIFRKYTDAQGLAPEAILQKTEERIAFAIDTNKGCVYIDKSREKPSKYFNNINGTDLGNGGSRPYWSTSIYRSDFLLEAKPRSFNIKDKKIHRRKAAKKPSKQDSATGLYKGVDDPRKTFVPGGVFTWKHFDNLVKRINKFGKIEFDGYSLKIEEHKEGNITKYKIIEPSVVSMERSDPNHYIIITKIFSSQFGFNIIHWDVTTGGGIPLQKFTWEYESVNGVFLPKRVITKHYILSGEVALQKENTYVNNKLNQTISPETFEYTNLKLKEGEIFIDEILNKEYRYKEDTRTLQPVEK